MSTTRTDTYQVPTVNGMARNGGQIYSTATPTSTTPIKPVEPPTMTGAAGGTGASAGSAGSLIPEIDTSAVPSMTALSSAPATNGMSSTGSQVAPTVTPGVTAGGGTTGTGFSDGVRATTGGAAGTTSDTGGSVISTNPSDWIGNPIADAEGYWNGTTPDRNGMGSDGGPRTPFNTDNWSGPPARPETDTGGDNTGGTGGDNTDAGGNNTDAGSNNTGGTGGNNTGGNTGGVGSNQINWDGPRTDSVVDLDDPRTRTLVTGVYDGTRPFYDLNDTEKDMVLNAVDQLVKDGNIDWNRLEKNQQFMNAYVPRFGDPVQGQTGAAQNTFNENGSVQGQYQVDEGGAAQATTTTVDAPMDDLATEDAVNQERVMGVDEYSSERMADIISQDSALMQLARQQGVDNANRLGLRNSSLSAGAQMRAMAQAAAPLALQEAEAANRTGIQNQALDTEVSVFNAGSENRAEEVEFTTEWARQWNNADAETRVSLANATFNNDMMNNDRQRALNYELQQLVGDQNHAKQLLASDTAVDVANIEGVFKQFISENDTAARMFDSYYKAATDVLSNEEFSESEATGRLSSLKNQFIGGMEVILGFESFDLNPGGGGSSGGFNGSGDNGAFVPNDFSNWSAVSAMYDIGSLPDSDGNGVPDGWTVANYQNGNILIPDFNINLGGSL